MFLDELLVARLLAVLVGKLPSRPVRAVGAPLGETDEEVGFDLRVGGFRWLPVSLLAVAAYLNFFTHHVIADLRWLIALGFVAALWGSTVHFTVGGDRYRMPTAESFVLIGGALWLAENLATLLGAWRYPDQHDRWHLVHVGKLGSWALLVTLSFVLVAAVKAREGTLYGDAAPRVTRA